MDGAASGKFEKKQIEGGEGDGEKRFEPCNVPIVDDGVKDEEAESSGDERLANEDERVPGGVGTLFALTEADEARSEREDEEETASEPCCARSLRGAVEIHHPSYEEGDCASESGEEQARPGLEYDENENGDVQEQEVSEENYLMITAGGDEEWGGECADDGVESEEFSILLPGHDTVECGDDHHAKESELRVDEAKDGVGGPE